MFRAPLSFFLIGICFSLMLTAAQAETLRNLPEDTSRNLPAEMGADLWLKADERNGDGGNGTVVSKWESKVVNVETGEKVFATQSSNETARIVGNQTTANNKDVIFFPQGSGTSGYGYFEIPSNFNLKNSTVLVSLKYSGGSVYPRVLSFLANGQDSDGVSNSALALMYYSDTNQFRLESNGKTPTSPTYSTGNWTILSYRIDGNGNMTVSLDGVAGNQISNPNMAAKNTAGKIHIARPGINRQRNFENLANAHIYEILIFNQYLGNGNYTNAQGYMRQSMGATSVQIVSLPTASAVNRGERLSQSILSGGNATSNGTVVAGNFTWNDDREIVTQTDNYSLIFVPDSAKYNFSAEVEVRVTVNPELNTSTNLLTGFRTRNGTASSSKSVSISGKNLTSNVTASVLSGSGFEVSADNSTFGSNATIPVVSGNVSAPLYVRLAAAQTSSGNKTAALNIPFGATPDESVRLEGKVVEVFDPYIEVIPYDLTLPVTTSGTPSASLNFTVNAYNLSGNLTANATTGFEIDLGNGTYAQTLEIPIAGGNVTTSRNLRVAASASAGALSGSVLLTSGNASTTLSANGTVNAPTTDVNLAPAAAAESPMPENSATGKKIKKQKLKKKPKKKKKSLFTFPQVVAASGTTWITAGGNVVSEQDRAQSNTSK